jgi:hypothetical protein
VQLECLRAWISYFLERDSPPAAEAHRGSD